MAQPKPNRSLYILCIDDDAAVRELLTACLTQFEHRVMVASGGIEGLEMFRAALLKNQPYDVVITDMGMPDIDGRQVARTIKAESPSMPIIMLTGWGKSLRDDGDTAPGVDVVVNKPPRMHELNDLLLQMAKPVWPAQKGLNAENGKG
jgi:CheY-like chemotaxis protein